MGRIAETALWIGVLGFLAWRLAPQVSAAFGFGAPGDAVPDFAVQTLHGDRIDSAELRGRVVLINVWATWCPPCRFEMPGFQRVYEDRRDAGFVILGLSTDRGGEGAVRDFLDERGITYPVAMAPASVIRDLGGVRAMPTSFLVDRRGRVRQRVEGIFAEPALRLAVDRLLEESPEPAARGGGR